MPIGLIFLFLTGFLIRLVSLNQSLWLDEATSAQVAKYLSYSEILTKFSPFDFHPPGYYFLLKFWTSFFGFSEISLRMPSVIASLLTGYLVFLIGKKIKDPQAGFWSAAFFLFNPLIIYYSQEARMYSITTLFLTALIYFVLELTYNSQDYKNRRSKIKNQSYSLKFKNYLIPGVLLFLSFFTFYGSALLIVSLILYLLYHKRFKEGFYLSLILTSSFLILSPLLFQQLIHAKTALRLVVNWSSVLGKANFKNLLLIPVKFTSGRISFAPKIIYYGLAGGWALLNGYFVFQGGRKNRLLSWLLIGPLILGLVLSLITPMLQYFRFLYLIPLMTLLLTMGIRLWEDNALSSFPRKRESTKIDPCLRRDDISKIVLVGFIIFSLVYLLFPQFHREDWKGLAGSLPKRAKVYMIPASSDALQYYRSDIIIGDVQSFNRLDTDEKEVVVIPYVTEIYGINYRRQLAVMSYRLVKQASYRGLLIEYWQKI